MLKRKGWDKHGIRLMEHATEKKPKQLPCNSEIIGSILSTLKAALFKVKGTRLSIAH